MGDMMEMQTRSRGIFDSLLSFFGRVLVAIIIPAITFVVLWRGFIFLRDSDAPQLVIVIVAIVWGVGGVACFIFCSQLGGRKDATCLGAQVAAFRVRRSGSGDPLLVHVTASHTHFYHEFAECRQHPIRRGYKIISVFLRNG